MRRAAKFIYGDNVDEAHRIAVPSTSSSVIGRATTAALDHQRRRTPARQRFGADPKVDPEPDLT